ncbi:hypothetical protein J4207_03605 [Candidatus Woesearchaeota archaeon]|nr:hypothetical protein [Candidatus Woesearchaeota archaeon]
MKKAQITSNVIFGMIILTVGVLFVFLWSIGEILGNVPLSTLGKWGLGLLPIVIEIIQVIVRGLK